MLALTIFPSFTMNFHPKNPVHAVCPDLQVKIADLGNACWEVSRKHLSAVILTKFQKMCLLCDFPNTSYHVKFLRRIYYETRF